MSWRSQAPCQRAQLEGGHLLGRLTGAALQEPAQAGREPVAHQLGRRTGKARLENGFLVMPDGAKAPFTLRLTKGGFGVKALSADELAGKLS